MTGFWQVSGRNQLTLEDRVKLEPWYVRNWTPWLDCIVFAKTFRVVFFPENGFSSQDAADVGPAPFEDSTAKTLSPALAKSRLKACIGVRELEFSLLTAR